MRKLSPLKAVTHAFSSVWGYRAVAWRIGMFWAPVLLLSGLIEILSGPAKVEAPGFTPSLGVELLTGMLSLAAVCSMAVSWHRFILRDEIGPKLRLDGHVLRYAATTLLIMLAMVLPAAALVLFATAAPAAPTLMLLPVFAVMGGLATRLSIKLPAVALGNRDFTFRDAWVASAGNFWPCVGVFLLNAAILLVIFLVLMLLGGIASQAGEAAALTVQLLAVTALQIFYSVFNASIFTSLYGFFVERREF